MSFRDNHAGGVKKEVSRETEISTKIADMREAIRNVSSMVSVRRVEEKEREIENLFSHWQIYLAGEPQERHQKKATVQRLRMGFEEAQQALALAKKSFESKEQMKEFFREVDPFEQDHAPASSSSYEEEFLLDIDADLMNRQPVPELDFGDEPELPEGPARQFIRSGMRFAHSAIDRITEGAHSAASTIGLRTRKDSFDLDVDLPNFGAKGALGFDWRMVGHKVTSRPLLLIAVFIVMLIMMSLRSSSVRPPVAEFGAPPDTMYMYNDQMDHGDVANGFLHSARNMGTPTYP